jgi:hypothetical protein
MRDDMFRVIVERPRRGGRYARDGRRYRNDPESGGRIGMRRGYHDLKSLNENLAPLQRFLQRQAGRRWNDVYADLCANIDRRNAVQAHICAHLDGIVAVHTRVGPNGVEVFAGSSWGRWEPLSDALQRLYVDPATGRLLVNEVRSAKLRRLREERRAKRRACAEAARWIDADTVLERIDGLWFLVERAPLPDTVVRRSPAGAPHYEPRWDVKRRQWVQLSPEWARRGRCDVRPTYARSKRQVSRRELKKLLKA